MTGATILGPGAIAVNVMCGMVSLLAAVGFFCGLILVIPTPPKQSQTLMDGDLDKYVSMHPRDFGLLPFDTVMQVNNKLAASGRDMIHSPWGVYEDDVATLGIRHANGAKNLKALKNHILSTLTSKAALERAMANTGSYLAMVSKLDKDKERADFGNWIADYLNDAGYVSWVMFPDMYKIMIMAAFPPLEELDNADTNKERGGWTMQSYEARMLAWLQVLDSHMHGLQKSQLSLDSVVSLH